VIRWRYYASNLFDSIQCRALLISKYVELLFHRYLLPLMTPVRAHLLPADSTCHFANATYSTARVSSCQLWRVVVRVDYARGTVSMPLIILPVGDGRA